MTRERWMALLFAAGSLCFVVGPFPGYVQLVGPGADAVTFFVGSILFTGGGALQLWLSLGGARPAVWSPAVLAAGGMFLDRNPLLAAPPAPPTPRQYRTAWGP